jgi:hypothetical protein
VVGLLYVDIERFACSVQEKVDTNYFELFIVFTVLRMFKTANFKLIIKRVGTDASYQVVYFVLKAIAINNNGSGLVRK